MRDDVVLLDICDLVEFADQPFKVLDDYAMDELTQSVKMVGVLVPVIVRKTEDDKYEIISGHRRKRACERAGIEKIPAVIAKLNDDEAAILLVDSNLHREKLLPSERAYAYKLKLDALKHQGIKNILTCGQNDHKKKSRDDIGESFGVSGRQVQRYIRLTELIFQLLDKVDEGKITPTAGTELSFLDTRNQAMLNDYIEKEDCGVSIKQAKQVRVHYAAGNLNEKSLNTIFEQEEKEKKFYLDFKKLRSYFPKGYTMQQCEDALWEMLDKMTRQ